MRRSGIKENSSWYRIDEEGTHHHSWGFTSFFLLDMGNLGTIYGRHLGTFASGMTVSTAPLTTSGGRCCTLRRDQATAGSKVSWLYSLNRQLSRWRRQARCNIRRPRGWSWPVMNIVWDPDSKFLNRPTRRWASISSTLERFSMFSQSSFSLKNFADERCKVCTIKEGKCELYLGLQSFSESLLFASVGGDVFLSIAGQLKEFPMIFINSCLALTELAKLLLLLVHHSLRNVPCTEGYLEFLPSGYSSIWQCNLVAFPPLSSWAPQMICRKGDEAVRGNSS